MTAVIQKRLSVEEYLKREIEKSSDEQKSEFFDGKIIDMPLVSAPHDIIVTNIITQFCVKLKTKGFRTFTGDVRVKLNKTRYAYPDVTLVKKPPVFAEDEFYNLTNPLMIVEVLSKSTESKDRGYKFRAYCEIESLKEYLIIAQDKCSVESFYRNDKGEWIVGKSHTSLSEIYQFQSIDFALSLEEIYEDVVLERDSE